MQRDLLLLSEMIDAARRAHDLVEGISVEELVTDRQRGDALLWNFTVLGEASSQVTVATKQRFPDIPWQRPARLHHRIVRGYWSVDMAVLHTTASTQLPLFTTALTELLDKFGPVAEPPSDMAPDHM
jgi:uncharacterized protein with HEPN domain